MDRESTPRSRGTSPRLFLNSDKSNIMSIYSTQPTAQKVNQFCMSAYKRHKSNLVDQDTKIICLTTLSELAYDYFGYNGDSADETIDNLVFQWYENSTVKRNHNND